MKIFDPLYDLVSWIILTLHDGFEAIGMNESWSWCLGIVGLVVIMRVLLIPLFVKQIKSMRAMQMLQPEIKKIQARYKGDRERTSQELMKLYKQHNTNPLSSCFPILAQAPFFFALFKVLNDVSKDKTVGVLSQADVDSAGNAFFFAAPLDAKFIGADTLSVQVITILMIVAMTASQFFTQKQLMSKNMPAASMESNPFMQQQKVMLYLFPALFAIFGINFPVGVLLYWLVSNLWSMGQQIFVIRRMPVIGSPAHEAMMRRKAKKDPGAADSAEVASVSLSKNGKSDGTSVKPAGGTSVTRGGNARANGAVRPGPGGRQQPQRQTKSKRAGSKKR
ncbi:MAG: membrane protein insertase YidC [Sporichthyaceae bacterium]